METVLFKDIHIFIRHVYTVIAATAVFEHPQLIQEYRRGHAVALYAALYLFYGLREMGVDGRTVSPGQRCHPLQELPGTGILRVEAHLVADQRICFIPFPVFFFLLFQGRCEIVQAAGQDTAHACVHTGLCRLAWDQIHVKDSRDARGQILQDGQPGQMVDVLRGKLRLHRENLLLQPLLQRYVVRERTQKRHGRVGVGVFETGHQKIAFAVNLRVPGDYRKGFPYLPAVGLLSIYGLRPICGLCLTFGLRLVRGLHSIFGLRLVRGLHSIFGLRLVRGFHLIFGLQLLRGLQLILGVTFNYICNPIILDPHFPPEDGPVFLHRQNLRVIKSDVHRMESPPNP